MSKPIAVSSIISVIAHISVGIALAFFQKADSIVLQVAPAQKTRVNVQLVQTPAPIPQESEEPEKRIVTTTAPSEYQERVVKKEPVKTDPKPKAVVQSKPKPAPKPIPAKTPPNEHEMKPTLQVAAKAVSSQVIESRVEKTPGQGASSEYRRIDKPQLMGRQQQPTYPFGARKMRHQGTVILDVRLDEEGKIITLEVEKTSGYHALDKAARTAVERWRFQPLIENGRGVRSRVRIPVRFRLG